MYAKLRELSHNQPSEWKSEKEFNEYRNSPQFQKDTNEYNKQYLKILYYRKSHGYHIDQKMIDHVKNAIK